MQASVSVSRTILTLGGAFFLTAAGPAGPGPSWTGKWHGTLTNVPARPNAAKIEVVREIGVWPQKDGDCTEFRTIYSEAGVEKGRKDYRLCRRGGAGDLVVDEGGGLELSSRLLGDTLVSIFRYDEIVLFVTTRVRGGVMEEEIYSATEKPAAKGVTVFPVRSVQRLVFTRKR